MGDKFCPVELIGACIRDEPAWWRIRRQRRTSVSNDHDHPLGFEDSDSHWVRPKRERQLVSCVVVSPCFDQLPCSDYSLVAVLRTGMLLARTLRVASLNLTITRRSDEKRCLLGLLDVRHRYQFRQLPEVLGGGCEEELIAGTTRSS